MIEATSWENLLLPYANNKAADQPAYPLLDIAEISRLLLIYVIEQSGFESYLVETRGDSFSHDGLIFSR